MDPDSYHFSAFSNNHIGPAIILRKLYGKLSLKHDIYNLLEVFSVKCFSSLEWSVWPQLATSSSVAEQMMCVDNWMVVSLLELRTEFHANVVAIQA